MVQIEIVFELYSTHHDNLEKHIVKINSRRYFKTCPQERDLKHVAILAVDSCRVQSLWNRTI
jgi:hypothetical protein